MTGDFTSITTNDALTSEIRAKIDRDGSISFRDFIQLALYHPQHGYYTTHAGAMSRGGDYVTSPEVHPVFGALLARQLHEMWRHLDAPSAFRVVELGGGTGRLARDIISRAHTFDEDFVTALHYGIVETSPALRRQQQRTLEDAGVADGVARLDALPQRVTGCVLSNEFFDALPVHRVVVRGGELREVVVGHDGARFVEDTRPASAEVVRYFADVAVHPGEGCYTEVNLEAPKQMASIAQALTRGWAITFDYGYEAADLYAPWRRDGTLLCFYRQSAGTDPYAHVGEQDITASVDFTTLRAAGEAAGLTTIAMTDQSDFLVRMGIGDALTTVAGEGAQLDEYFARRNVVLDLIDPGKLGRIKVLLQGKGVPAQPLIGFGDG